MGHWEIMSFWTLWHQLGLGYLKMDEHILPQPKGSFYTEITGDLPREEAVRSRNQHPCWATHKRTIGFTEGFAFSHPICPSLAVTAWITSPRGECRAGHQNDNLALKKGTRFKIRSKKRQPTVLKQPVSTNRLEAAKCSKRPTAKVSNPTCSIQAHRIPEQDSKLKHVKPRGRLCILTQGYYHTYWMGLQLHTALYFIV